MSPYLFHYNMKNIKISVMSLLIILTLATVNLTTAYAVAPTRNTTSTESVLSAEAIEESQKSADLTGVIIAGGVALIAIVGGIVYFVFTKEEDVQVLSN